MVKKFLVSASTATLIATSALAVDSGLNLTFIRGIRLATDLELNTFADQEAGGIYGANIFETADADGGNAEEIDDLILINPTGNIKNDIGTLALDIVNSGSLTSTLQGDVNVINTGIGGSGNTQTRLTTTIQSIEGTATVLTTAITDVNNELGGTGTTLVRAQSIDSLILTTPTNNITNDIGTLALDIVNSAGATLQADVNTINGLINGTTTGSSIQTRIGAPTVNSTASNLDTVVGGHTGDSLSTRLGDPGANFASIDAMIGVDVGGTTDESIIAKLGNSGTTVSLAGLIGDPSTMATDSIYTRIGNPSGNTTLKTLSAMIGGTANSSLFTQLGVTTQSTSLVNSIISTGATSVQAAITTLDASILTSPTGVISTDIATLDGLIVTSPTGVLQTDVQTINTLINGTTTGSTIQARVGAPTVNSTASNVLTVIGNSPVSIAAGLGDPVSGTTGLSGLVKNTTTASATVITGGSVATFNSATNLYTQIQDFLAVFNDSSITANVTVNKGPYASLAALINGISAKS